MTIFCPNGHDNPDSNRFCHVCGSQIVVPINNSMTGGVLLGDRYLITKEIGQGGFGRTYLCEDINRFNEPCVLKEFAPQVQGTALLTKAQELFEREAGVMYRLQHPQIPMFREMFRVNRGGVGQLFLVQDYVAGNNYQQLMQERRQQCKAFTETEITEFLTQILPVLGYIHSLGVIHRDISPDNLIRRDSDGLPMLIDFGGVKQVAVNAATQYMSGSMGHSDVPTTRLGKIGYAPNEQMQRGVVFPHSDLYALAATTLVLLTGKEPPDLIDPQNFSWNWREHINLSPNLASILDRMLQLRPKDRFESAQDILVALKSGNLHNSPPQSHSLHAATAQPPLTNGSKPQVLPPTVIATPKQQQPVPPTVATSKNSSLMQVLGKTWIGIGATIGAIGLGWIVASLTSKRPEPVRSPTSSNPSGNISTRSIASQGNNPTPTISGITTIASIKPTFPAALKDKGVNAQAYGDAVRQIFSNQHPQTKLVKIGDSRVQSQLDTIASELGDKLSQQLGSDAVRKIGEYHAADRSSWKSQVNKLHLSERSLIDLTNVKYRSITNYSAEKLGLKFNRFLNTPVGQVYLATMFDRVQAIQSQQAIGEIVFPIGGKSGTVSGTLQPGEGKAYIASLFSRQDIAIDIKANQPTNLSIYPPTSNLPAILTASQTNNWAGKTRINGYHEFVLVSDSDQPIQYELKLTASDLSPNNSRQPSSTDRASPNSNSSDKQPLW
jgi:serine/threonine protein kinase, bacterial